MSVPGALPDLGVGPECRPGRPDELAPGVVRLTAPNPSMMTGPGTNSYVVGDGDEVVVLDAGPDDAAHLDALVDVVGHRTVRAVAITHHHRDHAPGSARLAESLGVPLVGFGHAEAPVDRRLADGEALLVGALELVAWHTPGHASDHLCYLVAALDLLFTGDHLMQGSTVVIRPPDGDLTEYLREVARVRDAGVTRLAPGHGRLLSPARGAAEAVLAHRAQRAALVLAALRAAGPSTAAELVGAAYPDVGEERRAVATATCWAHLLAMCDDGLATSSGARDDPEARFTPSS